MFNLISNYMFSLKSTKQICVPDLAYDAQR